GFWGAALLADAVGALAMLRPRRRVPVNPAHLTDRFQLFVLIVLGESMARLISAAATRPWSLPLAIVLAAALITLAALWWAWLTPAGRRAVGRATGGAALPAPHSPGGGERRRVERRPAHRYPRGRRRGHHPGGATRRAVRRSQRVPAGQRGPARHEGDQGGPGRAAGDRRRRDGAGLHGGGGRARLPGARPHRRPAAGALG